MILIFADRGDSAEKGLNMADLYKVDSYILDKLEYAQEEVKKMIDEFYLNGTTTKFTPNWVAVRNLENELLKLEHIIVSGECAIREWKLINKYEDIGGEIRFIKALDDSYDE